MSTEFWLLSDDNHKTSFTDDGDTSIHFGQDCSSAELKFQESYLFPEKRFSVAQECMMDKFIIFPFPQTLDAQVFSSHCVNILTCSRAKLFLHSH